MNTESFKSLSWSNYFISSRFLFALFLFFWISFGMVLWLWGNKAMFLWINAHLTPGCGSAAKLGSAVGELVGMFLLILLSLRNTFRHTAAILLAWFIGSCFSWLFKLWLMAGSLRPFEYFSRQGILIQVVEGIQPHRFNHFPSGHTITIFSILFLIPALFPNSPGRYHVLFLLAAVFSGFSRVLLVHHWPVDVWAGMAFGVGAVMGSVRLLSGMAHPFWERNPISVLPGKHQKL